MDERLDVLKRYWGYDSFRPMQESVIDSALAGRDVLALMPTGGGKSICFQVPAMMRDGIAIVVSPLIALMKDQVSNLKRIGIRALAVYSGMDSYEIDAALDNAVYGDYKFLYVSPERLKTRVFLTRLQKMNVSFIVVDEAHCISQWGYDFRPDYMDIAQIRDIASDAPVIALTATATMKVAEDIMDSLGFKERNIVVSGFERPNLSYVVRRVEDKLGHLLRIVRSVPGSGIVYTRQRARSEEIAKFLVANGISASFYHAGLSGELREKRQNEWKSGHVRVMVSTNAFGMGIDKPDVRFVVHYDIPDSIEAYFQEAGRAGRDGLKSYAVLLAAPSDSSVLKRFLPVSFPGIDYMSDIYQKVFMYLGIPYEGGKGEVREFDISAFARHFGLQQSKAYYAVRYIEKEGYWTLTDEQDSSSRIMFIASRDELYRIQLGDVNMDSFIKTVLRLYTGLFSGFVKIDEEYIASVHRCSTDYVKSSLVSLSRLHIISYIPKTRASFLVIGNERLLESNFYINPVKYKMLRKSFEERLDSMISYVKSDTVCRSVFLSSYFGQEVPECGCCDVCLSKGVRKSISDVRKNILASLSEAGGRLDISELRLEFEGKVPDIVGIVRKMAQEELLRIEGTEVIATGLS